jgi:hypothetical protein
MKLLNKRVLSIILFALLILLFVKMNNIVALFLNQQLQLQKVDFNDYNVAGKAYAYMNPYEYNRDDLKEVVRCSGWAFAETEASNDDKSVYLILKGKKNTYRTEKCGRALDDMHLFFSDWKKITGNANNFIVDFSTVVLPEDVYEIYVYVEENKTTKGIVSTGQCFKKEGIKLYDYTLGKKSDSINPTLIEKKFDYGWIDVTIINNCIDVTGWEAIESKTSEDSDYYIVYIGRNNQNVTIHVVNQYKTNIARYLENNIYMASGFAGRLDRKSLPDETGIVYVVAENQGELYRTEPYFYDINLEKNP